MPKRKDKDGLYKREGSKWWWASFTDVGGKRVRRSTGTADRKEAEALLAKWRLEIHQEKRWGTEPAEPEYAFEDVLLAYLKARGITDRVRSTAKRLTEKFTGKTMKTFASIDVRTYRRQRLEEGVKPATVNREIALLSAAINYCRDEFGWNIPNPAAKQKLKEPEGRLRWLIREEAANLIRVAESQKRSPWLADVIRLAVNTGMRKGEMLNLEWRRVDFRQGLIYLEPQHTKNSRRRSIPLNASARAALLGRANWRATHCPDSPWVFAHADGSRIEDIKTSFRTALMKAVITDFRFHDLRHTCAAWLVTAGVPLTEVRDLLGHRTIQQTERYAHLAPENVRMAVEKLDQAQPGTVTLIQSKQVKN